MSGGGSPRRVAHPSPPNESPTNQAANAAPTRTRDWMSVGAAARLTGWDERTIRRRIAAGHATATRRHPGQHWKVAMSWVQKILREEVKARQAESRTVGQSDSEGDDDE
jgi:hypothetical protein